MMIQKASAIVVFEDRPALGFSALLSAGYRHCFCYVQRSTGWLAYDPLKGGPFVAMLEAYPTDDLVAALAAAGRSILVGEIRHHQSPLGLRPLTCVELVKQAIGRPAAWVLTPKQLFRFLQHAPAAAPNFAAASEGWH